MEAFEKIALRGHPKFDQHVASKGTAKPRKEVKTAAPERPEANPVHRGVMRCFNCQGKGHRAAECKKPRVAAEGKVNRHTNGSKDESVRVHRDGFDPANCRR